MPKEGDLSGTFTKKTDSSPIKIVKKIPTSGSHDQGTPSPFMEKRGSKYYKE